MEQLIWTGEQKQNKVFYDLRFPISKERLQMYISLKNPAQAKKPAGQIGRDCQSRKNDSLMEVLLYTKANYYYTFNQSTQGDACFRKLINQYKEKKDYAKVSDCYKNLISIARKANNAPLMERTYESFIVWTDSVKALTAQDELNVLKRKYDESLQTRQDKDSTLSAKQYIIIGLCTLVAILVATIIVLAILLLKFITGNRKLKKERGHSQRAQRTENKIHPKHLRPDGTDSEHFRDFRQKSFSAQAPRYAEQMQAQVAALKQFSDNIQELSSLENSLTEPYEMGEVNAGTFCESVMEKAKEFIKPDVTPSVNAPKLQVKTNKEQLERILLYLLKNAAFYTEQDGSASTSKRGGTPSVHHNRYGEQVSRQQQENLFKPGSSTL